MHKTFKSCNNKICNTEKVGFTLRQKNYGTTVSIGTFIQVGIVQVP